MDLKQIFQKDIDKEMRRQKVPRTLLRSGRDLAIYKRFGWTDGESSKNLTLEEENDDYRKKIKCLINNSDVYQRLESISNKYHQWVDGISNFDFPKKN